MPVRSRHQLGRREFVLRVSHAELCGHGEGLHLCVDRDDLGREPLEVERIDLTAMRIVATGEKDGRVGAQRFGQTGSLDNVGVETDDDRTDGSALALHECIGGQGGAQRDEFDSIAGHHAERQNGVDGAGDADGQLVMRGG